MEILRLCKTFLSVVRSETHAVELLLKNVARLKLVTECVKMRASTMHLLRREATELVLSIEPRCYRK